MRALGHLDGGECELGGVRLDGNSVDLDGPIAPVAAEDEEPGRIRGLRLEELRIRRKLVAHEFLGGA